MNCTLSVNTGACLSRRRVSTGVFTNQTCAVNRKHDRMGCRIEREPVEHAGDGNINTDGISMGSIQVPLNGQPIIMLADRQSTGGYPKIGTVITVDFAKIAQARPGQKIRFVEVSLDLAQDLYIRELNEMDALDERLNGKL